MRAAASGGAAVTGLVVLDLPHVPGDTPVEVALDRAWVSEPDGQEVPAWTLAAMRRDRARARWVCRCTVPDCPEDAAIDLKFAVAGVWQNFPNLTMGAAQLRAGRAHFDARSVTMPYQAWVPLDDPLPVGTFFTEQEPDDGPWDLVVVGSGAGGGTLAYEAAGGNPALRILVLEAGSYLFPVHIQNLPRREVPSQGSEPKGTFELWYPLAVGVPNDAPFPPHQSSTLRLGPYLGGRTLFWGALAPQMSRWELRTWPDAVRRALTGGGYRRAEELTRVSNRSSAYTDRVRGVLRTLGSLGDFSHAPAPLAVDGWARTPGVVPAGVFSSVDLLVERRLQLTAGSQPLYPFLDVRPNHRVLRLETTAGPGDVGQAVRRAHAVVAQDRQSGLEVSFELSPGGSVVLAAGTLCSPLVAEASDLAPGSGLVGRGLTDHPIWIVHFFLPNDSDFHDPARSSITLSRPTPQSSTTPAHRFNVKLALNTWLAQTRLPVPHQDAPVHRDVPSDAVRCQVVFMNECALLDDNHVRDDGGGWPTAHAAPVPVDAAGLASMSAIADDVVAALGGTRYADEWAPFGGVSHEAGTLRMSEDPATGVVDPDLKMYGTSNVYVCDLSVFPTCPAANPTLTLVALASRLAHALVD